MNGQQSGWETLAGWDAPYKITKRMPDQKVNIYHYDGDSETHIDSITIDVSDVAFNVPDDTDGLVVVLGWIEYNEEPRRVVNILRTNLRGKPENWDMAVSLAMSVTSPEWRLLPLSRDTN